MPTNRTAGLPTELSPSRLAVDRLTITLWAGVVIFVLTGIAQWLLDPARNVWLPSTVALCTACLLAGGVFGLRSRWGASVSAAGDQWAVAVAALIASNPLVYIVATGISYPAIGVMLVVVAIAALVPNGRAAAVMIIVLNVLWLVLVVRYPPEVSVVTAAVQIAKADAVAAVIALTWSKTRMRLAEATETARRLAMHDELTGLPNRRHLTDHGLHVLAAHRADDAVFGVVFVDVDNLKAVNDTLGHAAGDERIADVASAITEVCDPTTMFAARVSGDEFVIVVQPSTMKILENLAEAVRSAIERKGTDSSVGVAQWKTDDGDSVEAVVDRADRMMYADKRVKRSHRGYE